jgi:hypothetical protein
MRVIMAAANYSPVVASRRAKCDGDLEVHAPNVHESWQHFEHPRMIIGASRYELSGWVLSWLLPSVA